MLIHHCKAPELHWTFFLRIQCALAHFYFSWDSRESHDLGVILRSNLAQATSDSPFVDQLEALQRKSDERVINRDDMLKTLREILSKISAGPASDATNDLLSHQEHCNPLVLVLDALDEIPFGPQRDAILDFLTQLAASNPQSLRIIASSRRDTDIEERLVGRANWKSQRVFPSNVNQDIKLFVDGQICRHGI